MKRAHEFAAITVIVFSLCFTISTIGYSVVDPSISIVRIVRHGFPLTWLETTTNIVSPASPTQYVILWSELAVDIIFYLALSFTIAFLATKFERRFEAPAKAALLVRISLVILVAYVTRLASCGIHELLGHGLWAWVFGAESIQVYVSWLGFGWCRWFPSLNGFAELMAMAGGLINTFIIGIVILLFLYLVPRKSYFHIRFPLFWLGFWATITQASYLLLGGFARYGDPWQLYLLTGIPLSFFVLLGFILFLLVYFLGSVLFFSEVRGLLSEFRKKTLLFVFWLAIPIQVVFFMIAPEHTLPVELFLLLLVVSLFPSSLSTVLFPLFCRLRTHVTSKTPLGVDWRFTITRWWLFLPSILQKVNCQYSNAHSF